MIKSYTVLSALLLTALVAAQAPTLQISLGIRETGVAGNIGDDGGFGGAIEWVDRDVQTLTLDGTWQQFTFDLTNGTITAFTGNGTIDGSFGTIEHIRILNSTGITDPITLWLDEVEDTFDDTNGRRQTVRFGTFEGYNQGDEVMFQEPNFSGSTGTNLMAGSTTGVDNFAAAPIAGVPNLGSSGQDGFAFQFVDGDATRWVRLTTFQATNQRNPIIRLDNNSVITFWMRGGKCQPNLLSNGPGTAIAEMCGENLQTGNTSNYYLAGAPAGGAGAVLVSNPGGTDVPIFGGNLVSFSNFVFDFPVIADANGRAAVPIPGTAASFDVVFQSVFLDTNLPMNIAFANAVQAEFGR